MSIASTNRFFTAQRTASAGFTLIELMVALAVMAVLIAAAVPSFVSVGNGNRLTAVGNDLAAALQNARLEALRRGQRVILCNSSNGTGCTVAGAGVPWTGWIVFADANADDNPQATEILRWDPLRAPLELRVSPSISGGNGRVQFRPDGLAYSTTGVLLQGNLSPCIVTTHPSENVRDVTITFGSRVSVSRRSGGGSCKAPANP